ncbi:hypothetical protein ACHAWT_008574 [Skeletonema menzelii]
MTKYTIQSSTRGTAMVAMTLVLLMCTHPAMSFAPPTFATQTKHHHSLQSTSILKSSNDDSGDEARRLKEKADEYRDEAEKLRLTLGLKRIEKLKDDIQLFMTTEEFGSTEQEQKKFAELKARVEDLVRKSVGDEEAESMLAGLSSFSSNNNAVPVQSSPSSDVNVALTEEEMKSAIAFVGSLPIPVKDTLAKAAGYPNYDSIINLEEFVNNLYVNKDASNEKLRRLYFQAFAKNLPGGTDIVMKDANEEYEIEGLSKAIQQKIDERMQNSTRAMELFPRVVQDADEAILPREIDANVIFQLLDRTTFMAVEKPMQVEGGYIIRGENKRKTATQLLEVIDEKLAKKSPQWQDSFQLSFVEIYADSSEQLFEDALLITPNKFAPMSPKLFAGVVTAISLFSSFVYCIDTFSENAAVMQRLKEAIGFITQSTLGGTIVDLLLGGGDGILINQDPSTQIPLHPVAIGGFLGMIIHAFDLVPIGSTDGGRMSQAVLGRVWHLTFSSLVFAVLFLTSLFNDGFNLLLGFIFIYSFTQRDMEIPCKNEIDRVELPRAVAAFVCWIIAALILCPLK